MAEGAFFLVQTPRYDIERVKKVVWIDIEGKKLVVYGRNSMYNPIRIVHDYETGKVIEENYDKFLNLEELCRCLSGEAKKGEKGRMEKYLAISRMTELEKKHIRGAAKFLLGKGIIKHPLSGFFNILKSLKEENGRDLKNFV